MQAIQDTAAAFKETFYSVIHSRAFLKITSAILVLSSLIPNVALAVTAAACRAFNKHDWAQTVEYTRRKFVFIAIEHNIANLADAPLPVLTESKNLPTRSVIAKEEDRDALIKMRTVFLDTFPHLDTAKVQHMKIKGANFKLSDSMGLGATFRVMHDCLNAAISSEDDLIRVTKQFESGFDADAAAVQLLYHKMYATLTKKPNAMPYQEMYSTFAGLMNLQFVPDSHQEFNFQDVWNETDTSTMNRFDLLPNGTYFLTFPEAYKPAHGIAYLKYDFGSYLFDPEYGLMPAKDTTASAALTTLIKSYQDMNVRCEVFGFKQIQHGV